MARQTKFYRVFAHNTGGTNIGSVAFPTPESMAATQASTAAGQSGLDLRGGARVLRISRPWDSPPSGYAAVADALVRENITLRWNEPETPDGTTDLPVQGGLRGEPGATWGCTRSRTLTVVDVPTSANDEVYCGYTEYRQ